MTISSLEAKIDQLGIGIDALIAERDRLRAVNQEMLEALKAYFDAQKPVAGHIWASGAKQAEAMRKMRDALLHAGGNVWTSGEKL